MLDPEIDLSVVVPFYNEEDGIDLFFNRVIPVLEGLSLRFEIICIDDGSSDRTLSLLRERHQLDARVKVVALSRNFGKDIALSAGMDFASGKAVVPIDADLQDPPELIADMVAKWREGFEVVNARRISRESDSAGKRVSARWFYRIFNMMAERPIPENIGDFRLLDRKAVEAIRSMPERARFMKGIFSWVGFRTTELGYERPARSAGTTKWNFFRLWGFAVDGITAFSTFPLRIWSYLGLLFAVASFCFAMVIIFRTVMFGDPVRGYPSLMVVILFLGGVQLISLGVIGEYLGRIYEETKRRPLYLVGELHGIEADTSRKS